MQYLGSPASIGPGRRILIREFDSRLPGACWSAHARLNELAGLMSDEVRCADPGERRRLREMWIRETARW